MPPAILFASVVDGGRRPFPAASRADVAASGRAEIDSAKIRAFPPCVPRKSGSYGWSMVEFRYRGRPISQEDILYIRALVKRHPNESRRTLSTRLCLAEKDRPRPWQGDAPKWPPNGLLQRQNPDTFLATDTEPRRSYENLCIRASNITVGGSHAVGKTGAVSFAVSGCSFMGRPSEHVSRISIRYAW
jgi:hypothetical protein